MLTDQIFTDAERILEAVDFSYLENRSILITGATGLIGTYLLACLALLKEKGMNIEVQGQFHSEPAEHTRQIARRGAIYLSPSLCPQPWWLAQAIGLPSADVVIHAAGYAQPNLFMSNPVSTIRTNTETTRSLLEFSLRPGGKFLFISSSEVYSGLTGAVNEEQIGTTDPSHLRACYIEGKRCGEAIVNAYRQTGVNAKSARLALAYGPGTRKHDKRALNSFIERALTERKILLYDSGSAIRTYCYVSDAVEMLWNVLLHGTYSVYNVGGTSQTSIRDLADQIGRLTGVYSFSPAGRYSGGAPESVELDLRRIEKEFSKKSYVSLQEGLKRTIEWQKELYGL